MSKFFGMALGLAAVLVGSAAQAAVITYTLVKDDNGLGVATPGSFALYAAVSGGDNFGLASFGADLTGYTTVSNQSPRQTYSNVDGDTEKSGFTLLRSAANTDPTGSQDTINVSQDTVFAFGIGQTGGNLTTLVPAGFGLSNPATRAQYFAPVLLATGTYAGSGLGFVAGSVTTGGNVFSNTTGTAPFTFAATIVTQVTAVPEPKGAAMVGLASLAGLRRRRFRSC